MLPTDDSLDISTSESFPRSDRPLSPEQMARARSPGQYSVASRAMSPTESGDAPNIMTLNGVQGRSSPQVEPPKPAESFYNPHPPGVNGYARPGSRTGQGSVGNIAADLLRDLKVKEAELEGVKRKMSWMKEALAKATRSGYVYVERDGSTDSSSASLSSDDSLDENSQTDRALKFKQLKAQLQVSRT